MIQASRSQRLSLSGGAGASHHYDRNEWYPSLRGLRSSRPLSDALPQYLGFDTFFDLANQNNGINRNLTYNPELV